MLVIYMTPSNRWIDAKAWAKRNKVMCKEVRERCYRGVNFNANMFYSTSDAIASDYSASGMDRLTDGML